MTSHVSVVIPTFNNGATIARTMDSILSQDYRNLEVIVSDHHSTDNTPELLASYTDDSRVRIIEGPDHPGAQSNWNAVTRQASGDYIVLVCGDDLLLPESLSRRAEILDTNSSVVLVASMKSVIRDDDSVLVSRRGLGGLSGQYSGTQAIRHSVRRGQNIFGEPMNVMFRRKVWEKAGPWRGDDPYVIDQATYLALLREGDFFALPEVLASFRVSKSQLSFRLVSDQARQVRRLHRETRRIMPGTLSGVDLAQGNVLATTNALLRRLVYLTL
jgi:glycosyltransferase involved in cell wall biosynthesis